MKSKSNNATKGVSLECRTSSEAKLRVALDRGSRGATKGDALEHGSMGATKGVALECVTRDATKKSCFGMCH
jgi:hypothetical protein